MTINKAVVRFHANATPEDRQDAIVETAASFGIREGNVYLLNVQHDDGCPCTQDEYTPMTKCTCAEVWVIVKEVPPSESS